MAARLARIEHSTRTGENRIVVVESKSLEAATAFLQGRPDVDMDRVVLVVTGAGIVDTQAAAEADAQTTALLIIEAAKTQKPLFPSNDLERTAAVFESLGISSEYHRRPLSGGGGPCTCLTDGRYYSVGERSIL